MPVSPRLRVLLVAAIGVACRPGTPPAPLSGVAADVAYLASAALGGRATGSPGADSAASYIARRYEELRLPGAFAAPCDAAGRCSGTRYFQLFAVDGLTARNVAAVVPGSDSARRHEYLVAGAHYDHLGRSSFRALDREAGEVLRPGADDNASGAAAVLELARRFAARPARRSVLLVHFDAEEAGLVGSRVFVDRPPVALRSIMLMVNLDMVGRLGTGGLTVDATDVGASIRAAVDTAAAAAGLRPFYSSAIATRSDHASFRRAGVPSLALFTGFHVDYHRATDIARRVDVRGIERVVDVAEAVLRAVDGGR